MAAEPISLGRAHNGTLQFTVQSPQPDLGAEASRPARRAALWRAASVLAAGCQPSRGWRTGAAKKGLLPPNLRPSLLPDICLCGTRSSVNRSVYASSAISRSSPGAPQSGDCCAPLRGSAGGRRRRRTHLDLFEQDRYACRPQLFHTLYVHIWFGYHPGVCYTPISFFRFKN